LKGWYSADQEISTFMGPESCSVCHWSQSWTSWIHSVYYIVIFSHLCLGLPNGLFLTKILNTWFIFFIMVHVLSIKSSLILLS